MKNNKLLFIIAIAAALLLIIVSLTSCSKVQADTKSNITPNLKTSSNCVENTFLSQVGVMETGTNRGKQVDRYLITAGVKPGNPWCASFVYWTLKQCDTTIKLTAPAMASSWFPQNKTIYNRSKDKDMNTRSGDVFGVYYPEKKRIAHVGFVYITTNDKYIITVEGNTSSTDLTREGDGVFQKIRPKRTIYKISRWTKNNN